MNQKSQARQQFDAIVVGAGPAGSSAALALARSGQRVALIERGEYAGAKNVSGAALYAPGLLAPLLPNYWEEAPVERYLTRRVLTFLSRDSAVSIDFRSNHFNQPSYNGFTILRPKFDRWLAGKAQEAGALLITSTVVDDLLYEGERVIGVRCRREQGDLYAPIVIAADGANSFLAKKAGLQRELRADEMTLGVKEVLRLDARTIEERFNLNGDEGMTNEYLGYSSGEVKGGGFLYTNRDTLSIGVVVQIASLAEKKVRAYDLLDQFKQHPAVAPLLRDSVTLEYSAHMIPESGWAMLPKLSRAGLLVTGDAAGFVFATGLFLEGINFAIASGLAAAETAKEAHTDGDFSARSLDRYRRRLESSFVLQDLKRFRHAPSFVTSERMQNVYPEIICEAAERIFRSDGTPRYKLGRTILNVMRGKVSLLSLLRDGWRASRALFF
ncbi:MAG: FAD-dependent oxidoreductase [Ktedonobacteraceae bacterium]|nr:FAD-dependent oxidoreductase [Ktedonobacteraceae bacterium]MBO0793180.1 FAD-dependent oxidoreductase [Ktedonobacteraceae bacterium]